MVMQRDAAYSATVVTASPASPGEQHRRAHLEELFTGREMSFCEKGGKTGGQALHVDWPAHQGLPPLFFPQNHAHFSPIPCCRGSLGTTCT